MILRRLSAWFPLALFTLAAAWAAFELSRLPNRTAATASRIADLAALQEMQQAATREASAAEISDFFTAENALEPTPLRRLAEIYLEDLQGNWQVEELEATPLDEGGGKLLRAKITLDPIPWSRLDRFLLKLEAQRPPWKIESLEGWPGTQSNTGRAILTLFSAELE